MKSNEPTRAAMAFADVLVMIAVGVVTAFAIFVLTGCDGVQPPTERPDGEFEACVINADPQGAEDYPVPGWLIRALDEDNTPVGVYLAPSKPGCYWFRGPSIDNLDTVTLTGSGTHACFGHFAGEHTYRRGETWTVPARRNGAPCTYDYEADCRAVSDPIFDDLLTAVGIQAEPTVAGCCELYNDDQPICQVCPEIDLDQCPGGVVVDPDACDCLLADESNKPPADPGVDPLTDCLATNSMAWCCATLIDPIYDAQCGR